MSRWGKSRFVAYATPPAQPTKKKCILKDFEKVFGLVWIFPRLSDPGRSLYYNYQKPLRVWRHNENGLLSEREIDCGSTGALAFKDVGDFRPRSLVYFCKGIPGLANRI